MPDEPVDPLLALQEAEEQGRGAVATEVENDEPAAEPEPEMTLEQAMELLSSERDRAAKLEQSVEHGTRKISEQGEELGRLRAMEQYAAQQQAQQQVQNNEQPFYTLEQLRNFVDVGQITDLDAAAIWSQQVANAQAEQYEQRLAQIEQRYQQVAEPVNMIEAAHALDILKVELGNDGERLVKEHAQLLHDAISADESHFSDSRTRVNRMAAIIKAAEYDRAAGGTPVTRDVANPGVSGGSGAQPQTRPATRLSPEEQEVEDLQKWSRPVDDYGIPLPR